MICEKKKQYVFCHAVVFSLNDSSNMFPFSMIISVFQLISVQ